MGRDGLSGGFQMLNIIIGENSIGKTVILKERLKELGVVNVSTNLVDDANTDLDIDLNKVERDST